MSVVGGESFLLCGARRQTFSNASNVIRKGCIGARDRLKGEDVPYARGNTLTNTPPTAGGNQRALRGPQRTSVLEGAPFPHVIGSVWEGAGGAETIPRYRQIT